MSDPGKFLESLQKIRESLKNLPELNWGKDNISINDRFDGITFSYAGGACPVQAMGTYQDMPFYFRYRWGEASLGWGDEPIVKPLYEDVLPYGDSFDGFLTLEEFEDVFINLMYNLVRQKEGYPNGN